MSIFYTKKNNLYRKKFDGGYYLISPSLSNLITSALPQNNVNIPVARLHISLWDDDRELLYADENFCTVYFPLLFSLILTAMESRIKENS